MTPMAYDERAMMTLPPSYAANHPAALLNSINNNNNSFVNNSNSLNNNVRSNYYSTIDDRDESEVERRNRINAQLSAASVGGAAVSTIFRGGRPPYSNNNHNHHQPSSRSRTNPRSLDRRRYLQNNNSTMTTTPNGNSPLTVIANPSQQQHDPSQYIYHEPVFHEGLIYDGCLSYSDRSSGGSTGPPYPYVLSAPFTTFRNGSGPNSANPNSQHQQAIYSRDSSFGSDSGYSQHTQASNRSGNWNRNRLPPPLNRPPVCEPQAADS